MVGWRDWRIFPWLDRLDARADQRLSPPEDVRGVAQAYTAEPVLAAPSFEPNLPMLGPGPWALYVAVRHLWARVRGEALAENFILAVTDDSLVAVRTSYWTGRRVKSLIWAWDRADLMVTLITAKETPPDGWAIRVENQRLRKSFEAKPFRETQEANRVVRVLTQAAT